MNLKPCPYRRVDEEGHILCDKIKIGEREVTPNICRACPVAAIHCAHLRGTLDHQARTPITVRWGNGKSTVLDDAAPTITLSRAACAQKVIPIHSPRDCAGCALRQPLPDVIVPPRAATDRRGRAAPLAPPQPVAPPVETARQNGVTQKIIQLQEWLAHPKSVALREEETKPVTPLAITAPPPREIKERRVGWTD